MKLWVESDCKGPDLPLSLRLKGSGCQYNSIYNNTVILLLPLFIKCPKATSKSFTREAWLYDQTDYVRFNQMLTDINWNEKRCNFDDVDDICEEFSKTFLQI
jgi:hypothetical protein